MSTSHYSIALYVANSLRELERDSRSESSTIGGSR